MNRTRYIPAIIMLAADFVVCVATIYFKYTTKEILLFVLVTSVIFLVLGLFIKMLAEKYLIVDTMQEILEEEEGMEENTTEDKNENKKEVKDKE